MTGEQELALAKCFQRDGDKKHVKASDQVFDAGRGCTFRVFLIL